MSLRWRLTSIHWIITILCSWLDKITFSWNVELFLRSLEDYADTKQLYCRCDTGFGDIAHDMVLCKRGGVRETS